MYVCMYICMYVYMYVCIYVRMYVYVRFDQEQVRPVTTLWLRGSKEKEEVRKGQCKQAKNSSEVVRQ